MAATNDDVDAFVAEGEGAEAATAPAKPGRFAWWHTIPAERKRLLLVTVGIGFVVIAVAAVGLSGSDETPTDIRASASVPSLPPIVGAPAAVVPDGYEDLTKQATELNLEAAQNAGQSYIPNAQAEFGQRAPTPETGPSLEDLLDASRRAAAESRSPAPSAPAAPPTYDPAPPVIGGGGYQPTTTLADERRRERREQKLAYLKDLARPVSASGVAIQENEHYKAETVSAQAQDRVTAPPAQAGASTAPPSDRPSSLYAPGELALASLDGAINSDEPGPVRALVVSGPLSGAILLGEFTRGSQAVVLKFNTISFQGYASDISAVALDGETKSSFLATEVDTHFWTRWGSLILAGGASGALNVVERNATATGNSGGGSPVVIQSQPPADREIALGLIGGAGRAATQVLSQNFNRVPTVHVANSQVMWVLFLKPLGMDWLPARLANRMERERDNSLMSAQSVSGP
jgi:type IV secretory pathway VirB10-like protein